MFVSAISNTIASDSVIEIAMAGSIVLWTITELADDERTPVLIRLTRYCTIFAIPLLILFGYLIVIWSSGIVA